MDNDAIRSGYRALCELLVEIANLKSVHLLLLWDQSMCMPRGARDARGRQLAAMACVIHEKQTSPQLGNLIDQLLDVKEGVLNQHERAVVRDSKRDWDKDTRLTKQLAAARAELTNTASQKWVEARDKNDFSIFAPSLKELVKMSREIATAIDPKVEPYNVLLDEYERHMTVDKLDDLFEEIKIFLPELCQLIINKKSPTPAGTANIFVGEYDVSKQEALCRELIYCLGFNYDNGCLDFAKAPMTCPISKHDVRLATTLQGGNISEAVLATIHECGHALYDQGLSNEYEGLPVGKPISVGIHESQAFIWEQMVGKSLEFCSWLWPLLKDTFPELQKFSLEQYHASINRVQPGAIRMMADEVTYPLHIMLRYEIERDLISGKIEVEDVPRFWNQKMKDYLGVVPKDDTEGCLQDVHWSYGCFGYFPTYALGLIYSVQLFQKAQSEIPFLKDYFKDGQFKVLLDWLSEKIYSKGSLFPSGNLLLREATGEPLNPEMYKNYLIQKYGELYGLNL